MDREVARLVMAGDEEPRWLQPSGDEDLDGEWPSDAPSRPVPLLSWFPGRLRYDGRPCVMAVALLTGGLFAAAFTSWRGRGLGPAIGSPTFGVTLDSVDSSCYRDYNNLDQYPTMCFCQLAKNRACVNMPCRCPQGCSGVSDEHANSATFLNRGKATGCPIDTALLTVPKSWLQDINELRTVCPQSITNLLEEMMLEGYNTYIAEVRSGPVTHCIHAAGVGSVPWLHLHTICAWGHVDGIGMYIPESVAWCGIMEGPWQAASLAAQAKDWAVRLYGGLPRSTSAPVQSNGPIMYCRERCGARGSDGGCSCNPQCKQFGDCCEDYEAIC